ncbi:MAG: hypothetical protein IJA63_06755 [Akkermansia sp.]|nr:hypothetical protein [Akkermansia sp.]
MADEFMCADITRCDNIAAYFLHVQITAHALFSIPEQSNNGKLLTFYKRAKQNNKTAQLYLSVKVLQKCTPIITTQQTPPCTY